MESQNCSTILSFNAWNVNALNVPETKLSALSFPQRFWSRLPTSSENLAVPVMAEKINVFFWSKVNRLWPYNCIRIKPCYILPSDTRIIKIESMLIKVTKGQRVIPFSHPEDVSLLGISGGWVCKTSLDGVFIDPGNYVATEYKMDL